MKIKMNTQLTTQRKNFTFEYWLPDGRHGVYSALEYNVNDAVAWTLAQLINIFGFCEITLKSL